MKPVDMTADAIKDVSLRGGVVLDLLRLHAHRRPQDPAVISVRTAHFCVDERREGGARGVALHTSCLRIQLAEGVELVVIAQFGPRDCAFEDVDRLVKRGIRMHRLSRLIDMLSCSLYIMLKAFRRATLLAARKAATQARVSRLQKGGVIGG
jgi:hypothetical protein